MSLHSGSKISILSLDVGTKRIGVAYCPGGTNIVLPLNPIVRSNRSADFAAILHHITERNINTVIVGDPITLSGERGIAAEKMAVFIKRLQEVWAGTIVLIDERLTTAQSTKVLIDAQVSRTKRKQLVDGMAAALLLETYLKRHPVYED